MIRALYYGQPIARADPLNRGLAMRLRAVPWYASGPRWIDIAGRNHGTLGNGTASTRPLWSGPLGRPGGDGSLLFDGTDDTVTVPAIAAMNGGSAITAAIWIYPKSAGGGSFGRIFHSDDVSPFGLLMGGSGTSVEWIINGANTITGTVTANAWNHLVGTYDGANTRLYVNGVQASSAAATGVLNACATIYLSDRSGTGRAFDGYMDDPCLWPQRCLSAADVRGWYDQTRRGDPQSLSWIYRRTRAPAIPTQQGWFSPAAAADAGGGNVIWGNLGFALGSDDAYANAVMTTGQISNQLQVSDCGFSVPAGATINGVEVEVERSKTGSGAVRDLQVQVLGGGATGDNKASATNWPTTDTLAYYGGPADAWNAALTPALVNDPAFGVGLAAQLFSGADGEARVDAFRVKIYYSLASLPPRDLAHTPQFQAMIAM